MVLYNTRLCITLDSVYIVKITLHYTDLGYICTQLCGKADGESAACAVSSRVDILVVLYSSRTYEQTAV